jgi:hypothetical protein
MAIETDEGIKLLVRAPSSVISRKGYGFRKGSLAGSFVFPAKQKPMKNIDFTRELIKGRIAEIIFEQMFRETGRFTILRFGYEYTMPELAQYQNLLGEDGKKVLDNIRHAPDFALITEDKKQLYLVEVKYRTKIHKGLDKEIAKGILEKWEHAWLFIASPEGFFFEPCNTIVKNKGEMGDSIDKWINRETQNKYSNLLNEFERGVS